MAKNTQSQDNAPSQGGEQTPPAPSQATAPPVVTVASPPPAAPAQRGIFDELAVFDKAVTPAKQRHTLGAWARAKGVKLEQIREGITAGRIAADLTGDGPLMTEEEFDAAVDFKYHNTFGALPTYRVHVPAEIARQGAPVEPGGDAKTGDPERTV